jgi:5-oxopent-3-ene-1,2,5-tricarboxylate decarboxylase / 2-hydroxyhepta-2,4-diene-1,7-dioate isomerase
METLLAKRKRAAQAYSSAHDAGHQNQRVALGTFSAMLRTRFAFAPYRFSGVVCGALLNHKAELSALGAAVNAPPYKAPPHAPVLQVKPRNTLAGEGDAIVLPAGVAALQMGACLGVVIGRTACRVAAAQALQHVAGYTIVNDVSVPQTGAQMHYRPSVRGRARDGFCPVSTMVRPAHSVLDPDALAVTVTVNGRVVFEGSTAERVRGVAQLIADVSAFMTLQPGDLLLLGASAGSPLAQAGDTVTIHIEGLGRLNNPVVAAPP